MTHLHEQAKGLILFNLVLPKLEPGMAEHFFTLLDLFLLVLGIELELMSDPNLNSQIKGFLEAFGMGSGDRSLRCLNLLSCFSPIVFLVFWESVFLYVSCVQVYIIPLSSRGFIIELSPITKGERLKH